MAKIIFRNDAPIQIKSKRRGQIEMFGLAFIIVLISVGFFIFVSIKSQQKIPSPQKEFTNNKLANDFVLSILDVNVDGCTGFSVKDLIVDCARDHRLTCGPYDSCEAVNRSINYMLYRTFMSRRTSFRIYSENLQVSDRELINVTYLNCTEDSSQGQSGLAIISLYPKAGNVYLNMNICYR
ncbi:MAG: hypothetical protein ACP5OA_06570 [Candidatus Woesearchaeota archaeon]